MAGLVKAKKYDWKDSNLALFGTDTERKVRRACNARYGRLRAAHYNAALHGFPGRVTGEEGFCGDGAGMEGRW